MATREAVFRCRHREVGAAASCRCPLFDPSSDASGHDSTRDASCGLCDHSESWHRLPVQLTAAEVARARARGEECFERCKAQRAGDEGECPCPCFVRDPTRRNFCRLCGCKAGWHRPIETGADDVKSPSSDAIPVYPPAPNGFMHDGELTARSPPSTSPPPHGSPGSSATSQSALTPSPYMNQRLRPKPILLGAPDRRSSSYGFTMEVPYSVVSQSEDPGSSTYERYGRSTSRLGRHDSRSGGSYAPREANSLFSKPDYPSSAATSPPQSPAANTVRFNQTALASGGRSAFVNPRTMRWLEERPDTLFDPALDAHELRVPAPPEPMASKAPTITPSQAVSGSARQSRATSTSAGSEVFHSSKSRIQATIAPQPSKHIFRPGDAVSVDISLANKVSLSKYESLTLMLVGELSRSGSKKESAVAKVVAGDSSHTHRFLELVRILSTSESKPLMGTPQHRWQEEFHIPPFANCPCDGHPAALPPTTMDDQATITYSLLVIGKRKERLSVNDKISVSIEIEGSEIAQLCSIPSAQGTERSSGVDAMLWTMLGSSRSPIRVVGLGGAGIVGTRLDACLDSRPTTSNNGNAGEVAFLYRASCQFAEGVRPSDQMVGELVASRNVRIVATGGRQISASGGRGASRTTAPHQVPFKRQRSDSHGMKPAYLVFDRSSVTLKMEGALAISRKDIQQARAGGCSIALVLNIGWKGLSHPISLSGTVADGMLPRCPLYWYQPSKSAGSELGDSQAGTIVVRVSEEDASAPLSRLQRHGTGSSDRSPDTHPYQHMLAKSRLTDEFSRKPTTAPPQAPLPSPPSDMQTASMSDLESLLDANMSNLDTIEALRRGWR